MLFVKAKYLLHSIAWLLFWTALWPRFEFNEFCFGCTNWFYQFIYLNMFSVVGWYFLKITKPIPAQTYVRSVLLWNGLKFRWETCSKLWKIGLRTTNFNFYSCIRLGFVCIAQCIVCVVLLAQIALSLRRLGSYKTFLWLSDIYTSSSRQFSNDTTAG